jgi:PKD repeat protein
MSPKILLFIPVFGVLLAVGALQLAHGETPPTPQPDDKSAMTITSFDAAPQSGNVPLVVKFTASVQVGSANLPPLRWSYDFGDGNVVEDTANENISKMSSISHTYTKPGTYSAVLTVTDQVFNNIRSQTIVITVKNVTLFDENDPISVSGLTMVDTTGHAISNFQVGQQIGIQSMITNEAHYQRFVYVVNVVDENHVLDYFEGSSAAMESNQTFAATQIWTPKKAGNYTVGVSVWDSLADAVLLSNIMGKEITVQASGDASIPPTSSIQKSSASTIWFKYTPICCDGTPWGNMYLNTSSALPDFMKINNYFYDHGITIIKSMQTESTCNPCTEINEQPLDYSYYLLVSSSDENKMLNLGFQKTDAVPSDAHSAGL